MDSLLNFLIQNIYKSKLILNNNNINNNNNEEEENKKILSKNIYATTRLIIVLSSHRGPGRKVVLDLILKSFKEDILLIESFEENNLKYIRRLSQLIPLVCSSCKTTRESSIIPQSSNVIFLTAKKYVFLSFINNISI